MEHTASCCSSEIAPYHHHHHHHHYQQYSNSTGGKVSDPLQLHLLPSWYQLSGIPSPLGSPTPLHLSHMLCVCLCVCVETAGGGGEEEGGLLPLVVGQ